MVWMDNKRKVHILIRSEEGQSTVEYILLFVVVASLAITVFKSSTFQQFLGPNSSLFAAMAKRMEFSYRNGHNGLEDTFNDYKTTDHEAYKNKDDNRSRFFAPTSAYE